MVKGGLDNASQNPWLFFNSIHLWLVLLYLDGKLNVFHLRAVIRYVREETDQSVAITSESTDC